MKAQYATTSGLFGSSRLMVRLPDATGVNPVNHKACVSTPVRLRKAQVMKLTG